MRLHSSVQGSNEIGEMRLGDISPQRGWELALGSPKEPRSEPTRAGPV